MKNIAIILFITLSTLFCNGFIYAQDEVSLLNPQTKSIQSIIDAEKESKQRNNLIAIINRIDSTYATLHNNLRAKQKIVIFIDPAHGKLPDGRWQGGKATERSSCTNRPEEFYSIILSRALYALLSRNKHIEVKSTEDFMEVLKGKSEIYNNIPFSTTIAMAKKDNAFIILSEHLNNVSVYSKACGKINIPGIHIIYGQNGKKVLRFINETYSGFLTLYNKLDASGFSKNYALNLKDKLIEIGMRPNSWELGAVGDSRFSYFVDFPISVIYESGFISNPVEEKKIRDREFSSMIASSQYETLLKTIRETFDVDLSANTPVSSEKSSTPKNTTELLKLSRIAVFYLRSGETAKAITAINTMQKEHWNSENAPYISYYIQIKNRILCAEHFYEQGIQNSRHKHYKSAFRNFRLAWRSISFNPIYSAYKQKYAILLHYRTISEGAGAPPAHANNNKRQIYPVNAMKSSLLKPIIFTIEKNQRLENAIATALAPTDEMRTLLTEKFRKAIVSEQVQERKYSEKRKRTIRVLVQRRRKVTFEPGIYIVQLDKRYNVIASKRVLSVELNPNKFQNQLYLKNSFFSLNEKNKSL